MSPPPLLVAAGVSVITGEDRGASRATERTLLDFNTLTATFPDALPSGPAVWALAVCAEVVTALSLTRFLLW